MSEQLEKDIAGIKEFVRQSAEFIAYFELVDTKIHEWQQNFETNLENQQTQMQQQYQQLTKACKYFEEILTQAGLARFRTQADQLLLRSESQLDKVTQIATESLDKIQNQHTVLHEFVQNAIKKIEVHCEQSLQKIDQQLSRYDVDHFRRTANESCAQVERVAEHAVHKSTRIVRGLQWKTVMLTAVASLITAFAIGLYVSDEWPWEMHQQAMNEREAGKILMKAWPKLSHAQRTTILEYEQPSLD